MFFPRLFRFPFHFLSVNTMTIQLKPTLTKTRNPTEYNFHLENKQGEMIQVLGDGYCLVRFDRLLLKKQVKVDRKKMLKIIPLEWYVHDTDFFIVNTNIT